MPAVVKQLLTMAAQPPRQYGLAFYRAREIKTLKIQTMMSKQSYQKDKLTSSYSLAKEYGIFSTECITETLPPHLLSQRFGRSQKSLPHFFTFLQSIFCASTFSLGSVTLTERLNDPDDVVGYSLLQFLLEFPPTLGVEMVFKPCARTTGQPQMKRLSCLFLTASLIMSLEQPGCLTHQPCLPQLYFWRDYL